MLPLDPVRSRRAKGEKQLTGRTKMLYRLKYALAAGLLLAFSPAFRADTPADTLVIAHNIDDIITLDPAEAYELTGIEVVANVFVRIMRFEPGYMSKLVHCI